MIDIAAMVAVFFAGLLLGTFFFGGLLWTVGRGLLAMHPALWFFGSMALRFGVVLSVFYVVGAGRWERMAICAAGFFIARILLIRLFRTAAGPRISRQEAGDAP